MKKPIKTIKLIFGALWLLMLFPAGLFSQTIPQTPISGAFIDYEDWMMKNSRFPNNHYGLSADDWKKELEAFQSLEMDTIILKHLRYMDTSYISETNDGVDPTEEILKYADEHQLKVIVGLWTGSNETTWKYDDILAADQRMLDYAEKITKEVARKAWEKYGHHQSFGGWYVGQEIWNIRWNKLQIDRMRSYFRKVSDYCKGLLRTDGKRNNKPVVISPYFSFIEGVNKHPENVYASLLTGGGIDILMLQDSVGARCMEGKKKIAAKVKPYFEAFYRATKRANVEYWSNVETFKFVNCESDNLIPTTLERLIYQLENASARRPNGAPLFTKIITYDFFHFMSPVHQYKNWDLRKKLYNEYKTRFVGLP